MVLKNERVTAVTNSSAATTANYSYSPYGDSAGTGTSTTALQYTGRENDGATGLYYYRARYYSPQLGRFIAEDPIGLAGGTNFYAYTNGDPISYRDPSGEFVWIVAGAVIGAGANVAATVIANGGFSGLTSQQLGAAALGGAVAGGLGALAGPLGGTIALELGLGSSTGAAAIAATAALTAGASAAGQEAANLTDPCHVGSVANAAFWGGLGGGLAKFIPTKNLNTWAQASSFGPSTIPGLFGSPNAWVNNFSLAASAGVGAASNNPSWGPF
jgi:RHS repeat-associated protein